MDAHGLLDSIGEVKKSFGTSFNGAVPENTKGTNR